MREHPYFAACLLFIIFGGSWLLWTARPIEKPWTPMPPIVEWKDTEGHIGLTSCTWTGSKMICDLHLNADSGDLIMIEVIDEWNGGCSRDNMHWFPARSDGFCHGEDAPDPKMDQPYILDDAAEGKQ